MVGNSILLLMKGHSLTVCKKEPVSVKMERLSCFKSVKATTYVDMYDLIA